MRGLGGGWVWTCGWGDGLSEGGYGGSVAEVVVMVDGRGLEWRRWPWVMTSKDLDSTLPGQMLQV